VPAAKVIRALERMGFVQVRQKGSHVILKKTLPVDEESDQEVIEVGCVVPLHQKDIAIGTFKSILNQAGISVEEFLEYL
jgi:predicted RNA binding protein YcfA (HicA-like mRNA interferase family)